MNSTRSPTASEIYRSKSAATDACGGAGRWRDVSVRRRPRSAGRCARAGRIDRGARQPLEQHPRLDEPMPEGRPGVIPVLLPARHVLGDDEVVGLEAEARPGRRGHRRRGAPATPPAAPRCAHPRPGRSSRRCRGTGELADRALDEVGTVRVVSRVEVDVGRDEQLGRCVGVPAQDRLAADHDDLGVSGDRRRRPDDVLELRPVHGGAAPSRPGARSTSAFSGRGRRRTGTSGASGGPSPRVREEASDGLDGSGQDGLPRLRVGPRDRPVAKPPRDALARPLDESRVSEQALRHCPMQLQANVLGHGVAPVGHTGSLAPAPSGAGDAAEVRS